MGLRLICHRPTATAGKRTSTGFFPNQDSALISDSSDTSNFCNALICT
jgi:hypothetical protein